MFSNNFDPVDLKCLRDQRVRLSCLTRDITHNNNTVKAQKHSAD